MTTTQEVATNQVAVRDTSPGGLIAQYKADYTVLLPSHVKPDTWIRLAQGALKKGKKDRNGKTDLEIAAGNNPGVFLAAVSDAARLGLEPGTEQFYLTPRKVKGQLEILGIVGYQGYIELMYRAGAISSIVAECVYTRDEFSYQPGVDKVPHHSIDWDADTRGDLRLVYCYAWMRDGAVSKVVVLNKAAIATIKASSQGATSEFSPWVKHEPSMWLKSAVRQLAKWVPTSAEYRDQIRQDAVAIQSARTKSDPPAAFAPSVHFDDETGEVYDAELVDDEERPLNQPGLPRMTAKQADPDVDPWAPKMVSVPQLRKIHASLNDLGITDDEKKHDYMADVIGRPVESSKGLTLDEASQVIEALTRDLEPRDAAPPTP